ncbi:MAG: hypothetical protein GX576_13580 [Thauera phenolivorans]|uniref:Secreted protein n=1 Tax=Thauera phenolivorans TaxID=1792543 RepID=A0A7X7LY62_9RHOO|nr:hypothetical protein [Thauera phenolivorans]NLF55402.1 hypothetical protein [Thauera phenolivorans]
MQVSRTDLGSVMLAAVLLAALPSDAAGTAAGERAGRSGERPARPVPTEQRPAGGTERGDGAPTRRLITNCDANGCRDNLGNSYHRGGGGSLFGPAGRCRQIGGRIHCP